MILYLPSPIDAIARARASRRVVNTWAPRNSTRPRTITSNPTAILPDTPDPALPVSSLGPASQHERGRRPARPGDPVRRGRPAQALAPLEYWITRFRG